MPKQHKYETITTWVGNTGTGTSGYKNYERNFVIAVKGKAAINGSSDPSFLGDKTRHNPEEMLVISLSSCHMLWYLHLCSEAGVIVIDYEDNAIGLMEENLSGSGQFTEVILNPVVTVTDESMVATANALHHKANEMCFIARSVNFPVRHKPVCVVGK